MTTLDRKALETAGKKLAIADGFDWGLLRIDQQQNCIACAETAITAYLSTLTASVPAGWRPTPDDGFSYIYLTCARKSWHYGELDGWRDISCVRGHFIESYILRKRTMDLTADDLELARQYSSRPEEWIESPLPAPPAQEPGR